jgi:quinol monooxygenase YgiN
MVLYVMKWDIHPDKVEAYLKWTEGAIRRTLGAPGVVEFRAYRPAAGAPQVVVTYEFADMAAWATWHAHEDVQKVNDELHTLATNVSMELWGPSPVVPEPIRPGK